MAAAFQNLEDTPMLRKQLYSLELSADELRNRCLKLHLGCQRFMEYLGEACDGDITFAESLEYFGAGNDDPLSVAIGGPVMSRFTTAFRELGTYKELLHSQVEHMLNNRLLEFINLDLQEVKVARRQFEKAQYAYDQAREKFMSLKKGTRVEVISELEEELHNSKSAFERCRFNLISALANIEAKKKFEFLESVSAIMDAHMRYFKQGYELLNQMEPFIHEVLFYAQQSKEMTKTERDNLEKRIQEYRTREQLENLKSSGNVETPTNGDGIHIVGVSPYKGIEALMQSTAKGEVQTIKQGYLFKRSSGLRGDWKKRFFVLDSRGALYYYRNKQGSQTQQPVGGTSEHNSGVFGRFRFSHRRSVSQDEENLSFRTIDLQTSTIKIDAEQSDLRFCFRIISPHKTYTLQAENAIERSDWVDKITAVIASLLNSPFLKQPDSKFSGLSNSDYSYASIPVGNSDLKNDSQQQDISEFLRNLPGNDTCAECSSPDPEWASLNLGILLCIECSGVHRNLGVHISKVRSLKLDVKVWEPTMLSLFYLLGNSYCNSIWEELFQKPRMDGLIELTTSITKPGYRDAISIKEKFIQMKYVEKLFVAKEAVVADSSAAARIWEAIKSSDVKVVYRLLVTSNVSPNTVYDMVDRDNICHPVDLQDIESLDNIGKRKYDPSNCPKMKDLDASTECLQGCSLLHLACQVGELAMLELLLQFGADINMRDFHGRTPLHHCVLKGKNVSAKYLIKRGASTSIKDYGGQTVLERAMQLGPITDEDLFLLLVEST